MASLVLAGDTSGSITVSAPTVAGSNTQTLVAATGTLAPLISGTAITLTNQTAPDFTSIPSWVKRITVMFSGVSTNSTGNILVQLGDAGGYETTGYTSISAYAGASNAAGATSSTSGFVVNTGTSATTVFYGNIVLNLVNASTFSWVASHCFGITQGATLYSVQGGGNKTLSDTLTSVRLYIDGTQQFDAGTINILYE